MKEWTFLHSFFWNHRRAALGRNRAFSVIHWRVPKLQRRHNPPLINDKGPAPRSFHWLQQSQSRCGDPQRARTWARCSSPARGRGSGCSTSQPFPRTVGRLFPSRAFSWSVCYRFFFCPPQWAVLSKISDICCLWLVFFHPLPRPRPAWQEVQLPCIVLHLPQAKRWGEGPQVTLSSSF